MRSMTNLLTSIAVSVIQTFFLFKNPNIFSFLRWSSNTIIRYLSEINYEWVVESMYEIYHLWRSSRPFVTAIFDPDEIMKWSGEMKWNGKHRNELKFEKRLFSDSFFTKPNTHAGFITRINQRALDLLADYLREHINRFMHHGEIIFNFSAPLTNEVFSRIITDLKLN